MRNKFRGLPGADVQHLRWLLGYRKSSRDTTYPAVAQFCVRGLDIFAFVSDAGKLGEHVLFRDPDMVEAREAVVRGRVARERFWADVANDSVGKDLVRVWSCLSFNCRCT
jgi:hypothetical protein